MPSHETQVIDLDQLISCDQKLDGDALLDVAIAVNDAFSNCGFLVVINHGVSQEKGTNLHENAMRFFLETSNAEKTKCAFRSPIPRGYSGVSKENFAILAGASRPNDLVEKYRMGPITTDSMSDSKEYQLMYYPNKWPDNDTFELQSSMEAYYAEMERLPHLLLRIFEVALKVPEGFFLQHMQNHTSILSVNHYPPIKKQIQKGQLRLAEHTDVDLFTILRPDYDDRYGCLQVRHPHDWQSVPIIPGSLVVNLGDCFSYWTNNHWKSTKHRVVIPQESEGQILSRLAMGFFVGLCYDAAITRMPFIPIEAWRHKDTTYVDWRKDRIKQAMYNLQIQ
uniref:2OGFe(II) oxygenase family protein putative n=1 Tax=Albugo laibachii Nc14 TaxID=890382 RepID=F0WS61_9STRA|nr:2OGFe(II) oxygenase family protein putative [Albugo laibachii Nc14]|eukprot:CCA24179.1 2OGFe(II) oxygenase family protein putative [Albugo laibachii Nc14]